MPSRVRRRDRSTSRGRRRQAPSEAETLDGTAAAFVRSILRDSAGLAANPDPIEAELFASGVLSMWHPPDPMDQEPLDLLGTAVLERLANRPTPDTLAVLIAMSAIAEPPFAEVASAGVERLRAERVPEPVWSRTIGRPALVDAWISTDEYEDQSNVLAAYAYDHRPPHAINVFVDANFSGLIRGGFVADDPQKVRAEWTSRSDYPIRPLDEQSLADVLGRGIEMFDLYLDPPVSEEAKQIMPLVRSRLRLLPPPRPIEEPEVTEEERVALLGAFATSDEAADRRAGGAADTDIDPSPADLARWFIDFACEYGAGDPLRWSPIAVEILLLDWLPRKALMDPDDVAQLPDVLRRFVRYAGRRKGLPAASIAETVDTINQFEPEFAAAMADDERGGPAKQLVRDLLAAGVDLTDDDAVQRWIAKRNAALSRGTFA